MGFVEMEMVKKSSPVFNPIIFLDKMHANRIMRVNIKNWGYFCLFHSFFFIDKIDAF
jgi:hypothetical protein